MIIKFFLIFLLTFSSMSIHAEKVYKIALSSSCPYYCTNENKEGYIVEILKSFFEQHGIKVKFVTTPYARLHDSLLQETKDLALLSSFDLKNTSDFFVYDVTLGVSSAGVISRAGMDTVILDFIDLKGKTIFLVPGSRTNDLLYSKIENINNDSSLIQPITGSRIHERLVDLVGLGRAEYAIEDYNVLKYFYLKSKYKEKLNITSSSISGYNPLRLVGRKGLPIQNLIDKKLKVFVEEYRDSGKLKILLKKYNIIDWNITLAR